MYRLSVELFPGYDLLDDEARQLLLGSRVFGEIIEHFEKTKVFVLVEL